MKEFTMQGANFVRNGYVVPSTESYAAETCPILAGTTDFSGTHDDGELEETITGAKRLNLNVSFSDLWEE
jgi:hypothetical protein